MSKEQKKTARASVLEIRNSLSIQEIKEYEELIRSNLLSLDSFVKAQHVFCYLSFRSEVPTKNIIEHCQEQKKNVYIPLCVTETKEMILTRYDSEVRLITSNYGVQEPSKDTIKIADRNVLDVAVVPGSVFDSKGYRIGYGAGYYDKFFSHTGKQIYKIALAYSFQVIDEVPKDDFDVPVDCIVTEKGIILCKR